MPHPALPPALLAAALPALAPLGDVAGLPPAPPPVALLMPAPEPVRTVYAQVTIRQRVTIKVPRMSAARIAPLSTPVHYNEKRGPKCVAVTELGGALIAEPGAVDLVVQGGKRLRARLDDDCGPMDFYAGFYLRPASDGKVCAGRDVIRIRSGAGCTITRFRTLVPAH